MLILVLSVGLWKLNNHLLTVRIKLYLVVIRRSCAHWSICNTHIIIDLLKIVHWDLHRCILLSALLLEKLANDVLINGRGRTRILVLLLLC